VLDEATRTGRNEPTTMGQQHMGQRCATWLPGESGYEESLARPDTKIDPATHQAVWFLQEYEDGNWRKFGLLRSLEWIREQEIEAVGDWVEVSGLDEMGVEGEFQVMAIDPCPTIEPGPGRIITAEFQFSHGVIFELTVSGQDKPIRGTSKHPYWSEDRHDWVPLDELRTGERLLVEGGTAVVLGVDEAGTERVCNFEVDGDHCYRVGAGAVLVHNASTGPTATTFTSLGTAPVSVTWWNTMLKRPKGMTAVIVNGTPATTGFTGSFPNWWSEFIGANTAPSGSSWEKGHLLAKRFGGPATEENLSPQYFLVNQSAFKTCENRINDALSCGNVTLTINVKYASANDIIPQSFTFVATGKAININEVISNVVMPMVPAMCKIGASGGQT